MLCDICHKNEATIFINSTKNTPAQNFYICENCAKKINSVLVEHLNQFNKTSDVVNQKNKTEDLFCLSCGTSLSHIRHTHRIGCEECLKYFRSDIIKIMEEKKDNIIYTGILPKYKVSNTVLLKLKQKFQIQLKKAVANEEYELAAYFRDKLKDLKNEN